MCRIQCAMLFIYFPGVDFLLVIYVLLRMIRSWGLCHSVYRDFGRWPRLKLSHGLSQSNRPVSGAIHQPSHFYGVVLDLR